MKYKTNIKKKISKNSINFNFLSLKSYQRRASSSPQTSFIKIKIKKREFFLKTLIWLSSYTHNDLMFPPLCHLKSMPFLYLG